MGATFTRGSRPLDGAYGTAGVECTGATILPKFCGARDHRVFILDFDSASLIGDVFPNVQMPAARNLTCDNDRYRNNYIKVLEQLADRHRMYTKMDHILHVMDDLTEAEFLLLIFSNSIKLEILNQLKNILILIQTKRLFNCYVMIIMKQT